MTVQDHPIPSPQPPASLPAAGRRPPAAVLFISNGHGEDAVATAIIGHLPPGLAVLAIPLVGRGDSYQVLERVERIGPVLSLPSGGFIVRQPRALWQDLQAGLLGHIRRQWQALRSLSRPVELVVAVGDITAVLFSLAVTATRYFVGTAKTDYYRDWGERYFELERWILRWTCRRVFARDRLTAGNLRRAGVPADFAGNPMMDGLEVREESPWSEISGEKTWIAVLPGSRAEAYENWPVLLQTGAALQALRPDLLLAAALPPSLDEGRFRDIAVELGWRPGDRTSDPVLQFLQKEGAHLLLARGCLGTVLSRARLCLGLAGTANEQAVGLGVPVVAFISPKGQYTAYFARRQQQLLGEALTIGPRDAGALASLALSRMDDEPYRERVRSIGRARFGEPGAARRIARFIEQELTGG